MMTLANDFELNTALETPDLSDIEFNLEAWKRNDQEPVQDYAEFYRRCLRFQFDRTKAIGRLLLNNQAKALGLDYAQALEVETQVHKRLSEKGGARQCS